MLVAGADTAGTQPSEVEGGRSSRATRSVLDESLPEFIRVQLAPGRQIPGTSYRIIRWIGEGAMGVVYEAEHIDIDRRVALKILRPEFCQEASAVKGFRHEARATSKVGAQNIIEVFDFAELTDGRLMIAMELLEGQELTAFIEAPMDPARTIGILRQVCRGMAAAHASGLVHRDLKPENIFLAREGRRSDKVKILDFGIAVFVSGDLTHRPLAGTPLYISPEMISSSAVGPKADIYALGCVAYEMLTGRPAFDAPSLAAIMRAHLELMPPPPSSIHSQVPAALDAVVMKAIAKQPSDRFATMAAMEAALCEAQIASGLVTPWDDLPLPDVGDQQRDRLLRGMPDPMIRLQPRSRLPLVLGVVCALALGSVVTAIMLGGREPTTTVAHASLTDQKAVQARDAASRAYWVYPPPNAPDTRTAFQVIRELEELDQGQTIARELRIEFSATLTRLGDSYWEQEGGRRFARAYYQQALLFAPETQPAKQRADFSDEAREGLAERANRASFRLDELTLAEPLFVLAEPDNAARSLKLAAYQDRQAQQHAELTTTLAKVSRDTARTRTTPSAPPSPRTQAQPVAHPGESASAKNPKAAKRLASKGRSAARQGRTAVAKSLFERALTQDPRNTVALAGMRDIYFERGDYGRAVRYGKRTVAVLGRNSEHRLRLGDAYYKVARYRDAETQYAKALGFGESRAQWRLEKARKKLGK